MVSKSKFRKSQGQEEIDAIANLAVKLKEMKTQIQSERVISVGEKLENNSKNIQSYVSHLKDLATSRADSTATTSSSSGNLLSLRMNYPLCKVSGPVQGFEDRDGNNNEDVVCSTTAKLPLVEKISPYTTWIFLDRNQRMADDQSVLGRRRIYYDQHGSETLICSDSEEDLVQLEAEKREYSEGEDRLMRVAFLEHGVGDEVVDLLTQFVGGSTQEIQEHYTVLMEKDQQMETQKKSSKEQRSEDNISLDQSLTVALDSFENLFCRRCLVFDCRLHGCSQALTYPNEKQVYQYDTEEDRKPCGDQCYLQLKRSESEVDMLDAQNAPSQEEHHLESQGKTVALVPSSSQDATLVNQVREADGSRENEPERSTFGLVHVIECLQSVTVDQIEKAASDKEKDSIELPLKQTCKSISKASHGWSNWKPLEKDLYLKGLEIFGRNSCFIARNLLPGLRTCKEVSNYMYGDGASTSRGSSAMLNSYYEDVGRADMDPKEPDMAVKSRICRKRGRVRKVKSSWKSAGHPSLWRRIADGKDEPYKQYTPCGCQPTCGKQCPCLQSGTCCEKYCGCAKSCKNRFRGCHCAKSQCKSRQCPCFAARRECDPDVCRNCWISCGDGSLGEPPRRGDSQCGNMKLLLRQQQRILLSKSEVAGWGAFIQNPVNKNDYLGEYTGELISHQEADKRGKIYDRANSSFLFDLNNKYVLDAYRKGDKLKFANHSSNPNCYAKVMLVAGDHRVGIYANEHLQSGEEIFYDYRYGPDEAPSWARKPETSKRECLPLPHGRAKKHQSG